MSSVIWEFGLTPVDRTTIEEVESSLGIVFPEAYVDVAMQHHGGTPYPDAFDLNDSVESVNALLSFDQNEGYHILNVYKDIQDRLVEGVYPFAEDGFGNYICFDYRNKSEPAVVFWEHEIASYDPERAIIPLCGSFTEFVSLLRETDND